MYVKICFFVYFLTIEHIPQPKCLIVLSVSGDELMVYFKTIFDDYSRFLQRQKKI